MAWRPTGRFPHGTHDADVRRQRAAEGERAVRVLRPFGHFNSRFRGVTAHHPPAQRRGASPQQGSCSKAHFEGSPSRAALKLAEKLGLDNRSVARVLAGAIDPARACLEDFGVKLQPLNPFCL